ncbi:MAG: TetR/AcrR family transcriptional regulator [Calditrichia bacterium]
MSAKREKLIQTATVLFEKHGIKRVTVEEICQQAGVSKVTFYKFFKNKLHLAEFVLTEMLNNAQAEMNRILDSNTSFQQKIAALIELKMKYIRNFSNEFIQELSSAGIPELKAILEEKSEESLRAFLAFLEAGKKKGEIRPTLRTEFILYQIQQMNVYFEDENLRKHYLRPQDLIRDMLDFLFYGILNRRDET